MAVRVAQGANAAYSRDFQAEVLKDGVREGVEFMIGSIVAVVCLTGGFVGGYFFAKTKVAREFERKAGQIGDVIKQ